MRSLCSALFLASTIRPSCKEGSQSPPASACDVAACAQVAKRELALECDYSYEAECQKKFRELVMADTDFALHVRVPGVVPELCTPRLLTTEWVPGVHIDKASS